MYEALAGEYDRFVNWQNRLAFEIPFILKQLDALGKGSNLHVLDAACGTGMHAIEIARHGYTSAGADLFPEMIKIARENALKAGVSIQFETAGFGELARFFPAGSFDALLCLGNSLPHLLTPQELSFALRDFAACLRPGGLLLIQNRNFDSVLAKHDRWMEPQSAEKGNEQWVFERFYDFEPDGLIRFNIVTLKRTGQEEWRSEVSSTFLRPQKANELQAEVLQSGFEEVKVYGSMQGEPFEPLVSSNLILTALRK